MGLDHGIVLRAALFLVLTGFGASATFLSDDVLQSHGSTGRSLLQAIKKCPLNVESMNYTIITSKCKRPAYPADLCCAAFKQFACPYVDEINDLTTDCASTMFNYINKVYLQMSARKGKMGSVVLRPHHLRRVQTTTQTLVKSTRISSFSQPFCLDSCHSSLYLETREI